MEEPQPNAAPVEGAGAPAQPAPQAPAPAAQPQEPQSQGQPAQADDTAAWFASKGIDPNDPGAINKLAEMARNSEKQMTKATQEASELRRSLTPSQPPEPQDGSQGDPAMQEFIQDYRRDKLINGFKEAHPDWNQHEPAMAQILGQQSPSGYTYSQLVNAGVIGLEVVYTMAKAAAPVDTTQIKTQAQQEVLQTLANTQRAGGGNAHASNPNPQAPSNDPVIAAIKRNRGQ